MIKIKSIKSLNTNNNYNSPLPDKSEFKYMNIDESMNYMDSYMAESSHDIHLFLNESYTDSMILNESVFDKVKEFFKKIKEFIKKMINKVIEFFEDKIKPYIFMTLDKIKFIKSDSIVIYGTEYEFNFIDKMDNIKSILDKHPIFKTIKDIKNKSGKDRGDYIFSLDINTILADASEYNISNGLEEKGSKRHKFTYKIYKIEEISKLIKRMPDIRDEIMGPINDIYHIIHSLEKEAYGNIRENDDDSARPHYRKIAKTASHLKKIVSEIILTLRSTMRILIKVIKDALKKKQQPSVNKEIELENIKNAEKAVDKEEFMVTYSNSI